MHFLALSLAVVMAMTHQAMAFTYWIDSTCTGDRSMDDTVTETKKMAERAYARLNSASDTDFQHVYEYAMKRKKDTNDAVFKSITDFMKDVRDMTPEKNRNAANVRIYCDDNEGRWKERIDPKTERRLGGWDDNDNWIRYNFVQRPGCLHTKDRRKTTYGEAFKYYKDGDSPEKQADVRATISMCDLSFFTEDPATNKKIALGKRTLLTPIKSDADLSKVSIDRFWNQTSKTLLHELSHTNPYATTDHWGAYNWNQPIDKKAKTVLDLTADELATHADVRAILGQLAYIADRGFTLHRKPHKDAGQDQKNTYDEHMKIGRFHKYENISKRSLQRRKMRFARRYGKV